MACVGVLVKAKADFTATDNEGATPMHYASQHSDTEVLRALHRASASSMVCGVLCQCRVGCVSVVHMYGGLCLCQAVCVCGACVWCVVSAPI